MDATTTRQRILEETEKQYAERGFDGMSMRTLTSAAGVNLAAVNYHFGSKKELIIAMFRERVVPVNTERMALLKKAREAAGNNPIPLEVILDAFLAPVARRAMDAQGADLHFLRMIGRFLSEDAEFWQRLHTEQFVETAQAFQKAIHEALPELSTVELQIRFHFCVGAMLGSLVKHPQFVLEVGNTAEVSDVEQVFKCLRNFLCAGFRAGLSGKNV